MMPAREHEFDPGAPARPVAALRPGRAGGAMSAARRALFAAAALLAAAGPAGAQTFGQFTTAAVAPLGEGCFFITAGSDEARAGIAARFRFSDRGDAAVQLGYDRAGSAESFGFGFDYKRYLISSEKSVPIDIAGGVSYGRLAGSQFDRSLFGMHVIVSGILAVEAPVRFEPYGSVGFVGTLFHRRVDCGAARPPGWPCRQDKVRADSGLLLRGGVKAWLNEELQIYVELKRDDTTSLGAALNVVF